MGSFSLWHWDYRTDYRRFGIRYQKLRNVGKDLGGAVHDFKQGLNEGTDGKDAKRRSHRTQKTKTKHNPCLISVLANCCWSALSP